MRLTTICLGLCLFGLSSLVPCRSAVAQEKDSPRDDSAAEETREPKSEPTPKETAPATSGGASSTPEGEGTEKAEQNETFDALVERAQTAYRQQNWEAAATSFERAYELQEEPNLLYNLGRVHEKSGDFEKAISYYERFVDEPGIDIDYRKKALERIETLERIVELEDDETSDDAEPASTSNRGESPKKGTAPSVRRESNYTWAIVCLSLGGASLGGGTAFSVLTANAHSTFEGATTRSVRRDAADRGRTFGTVADVLMISGGIVTATGLGFAIWPPQTRVDSSSRTRLRPMLTPERAGLLIGIDF